MPDLNTCAIHTFTNKPWTLAQCCEKYAAAGVGGISVWRNVIEPIGLAEAARIVRASGLKVAALVRGGFFLGIDPPSRQRAIDENRICIDEAAALGAEMVVLVVGAVPGMPLDEARKQVAEGIAACLPHAQARNIRLAIEPLHPMYAADKSCINRMREAREICQRLRHPLVGIACDVYHVWWDPDLRQEIALAGRDNRLFGFHVCDWRVNTRHLLTDRGLMGDGCINIRQIRAWVEAAGFSGMNEVEVFSEEYWAMDQDAYLEKIVKAYGQYV
jgi:sugar phosphate isomerase/epimerase